MSVMAKAGYDSQVNQSTRIRVTGSLYTTGQSASNTLYTGDRAGSRYYDVLENLSSNETSNAWSGNVRPGFSNKVTAWVINPFIKIQGLELFGNIEQAKGSSAAETTDRTMNQYAGEAVYRFADDQLYVAGRYCQAKGRMPGIATDVSVNRVQVGAGWFLSQNMEGKAEYVSQKYNDFPTSDIRNGGKFSGVMVEGVVSF